FQGFIYTIAYRMVIDHFRQNKTSFHCSATGVFNEDAVVSDLSSDELLNRHQLDSLYDKALRILPEKRKEIFLLSRHNGLSNKQIAAQLQISVKTVENQMTAALATLRSFFSQSDIGRLLFILFFFNTE
ncbi:MAG: sigma-70 family RNA polymerase sigma factor, partial [Gloeobacteraceae cyanobacterium ES-bin-316]|nr:sigma-70 family RNA polymerase sigma factor [Ferruginibacter sp.]